MTSVVWWLKDGRHQITAHHQEAGVWVTRCGLSITDTGDEEAVTTMSPSIACGACMTAPARERIEATRVKHAANTKLNPNRFT